MLGQEDPLEKEMEIHSSIHARKITLSEEPDGLYTVCGVAKSRIWLSPPTHNSMMNKPELSCCCCFVLLSKSKDLVGRQAYQIRSVAQSCPTICDPMNRSTPGLPVHHQLPEFTQTQVHRVSDAIQPSHPLLSPSPLAPNPSKHQSLFQWVNSLYEVAKVLEFQL